MNTRKCLLLVAAGLGLAAISASALVAVNKTFRTTGFFIGLTQGTNAVSSNPQFDSANFAGWNLVNLAMGRSAADTSNTNQVMAMTFDCDLSSASLVVYDRSTSNVVATIAESTSVDSIKQQDVKKTAPNHAHFVGQFKIDSNGNGTNGLQGGFLTIAGHVRLNAVTGCPEPVLVGLDRDSLDRLVGDSELSKKEDPDSDKLTQRAGLAHLIGVVDVVNNGTNHTILVPFGHLSIRRELPIIAF
jgi:hypothetical protein